MTADPTPVPSSSSLPVYCAKCKRELGGSRWFNPDISNEPLCVECCGNTELSTLRRELEEFVRRIFEQELAERTHGNRAYAEGMCYVIGQIQERLLKPTNRKRK